MGKIKEVLESLTPILISPRTDSSITIGLSKRFLLFRLMQQLKNKIQDDPHSNFLSALKYYKVVGKFLTGSIKELYCDRNDPYFKKFFPDEELYRAVRRDLEWAYAQNPKVMITITKRGLIVYNNYKKNKFNVLLTTIHSGSWMPEHIAKKHAWTKKQRTGEEDVGTQYLYGEIVLNKGGVWIDNKFSRFACDYNRPPERAIYTDSSEYWIKKAWKESLTETQKKWLIDGYHEFYFLLEQVVDTHKFNILFDGHSMNDLEGRPEINIGTRYVPLFYMPIVRSMQQKLRSLGYRSVVLDAPYKGGNVPRWLYSEFSDQFIFFMELNKKMYMKNGKLNINMKERKKLAKNLTKMFDIESTVDRVSYIDHAPDASQPPETIPKTSAEMAEMMVETIKEDCHAKKI